MAFSVQVTPGALKQLRSPPSTHQQTFRTALDRLPVFVAGLLAGSPPISAGVVTIKQIVFEARHLEALLALHHLPTDLGPDTTIRATSAQEVRELLTATFEDWIDFYFKPKPSRFLVYADHDEYTTVFSARKTAVSRIAAAMAVADIAKIPGYSREV